MANIKFSQFTEKTTLGTVDFLVGYTGAENVQISPTNLLSTFVSGSGTAGQVAYFDPSNNLAGENDFFWDYTNNRLGIGTISPSKQLHVRGSAPWIRIEEDSASNKRLDLYVDPSTAIAYIGANQSAQQLRFQTGSADRLNITNAGNVGIGTTSPSAKLEVDGTLVATGISQLGSGGANVYLTSSSAGNVGIGTSSPSDKLDIAGAARFTSNISFSSSKAGRIYKASNHGLAMQGVTGTENDLAIFSPTGSLRIVVPTGTNNLVLNRDIGNVGIGTSSPSDKLTVDGNLSIFGNKIYNGSAANSAGVSFPSSTTRIDGYNGITFHSSTTTVGSQSERMRITNNGNVGIGITSPSEKFEVAGPIVWNGSLIASQTSSGVLDRSGDNIRIRAYGTNAGSGAFQIRTGGGGDDVDTLALTIDSSQNATFAGNVALTGDLKVTADAATADIVAQWADSNGNNTATFRTTTPGQIFEIRSQNSGTLKFDSTSSTFTGNVVVNSSNSTGVNLKVGGESGNGIKTQYIFSGSGQRNWQIGMASHLSQTLSITPSTANGNTTFTTPILNLDGSDNSSTFAGDVTVDSKLNFTGTSYQISGGSSVGDIRFVAPRFRFYEDTISGTAKLQIDGGNATFAGSVIAGGGTPQGASGSILKLSTSSGNTRVSVTSEATSILDFGNQADFDNGGILYDNVNKDMTFKTSANERMRITSSGVIQNADIDNTTSAALKISNNAGAGNFTYGISIEDDSTNTGLILFSNAAGTSIGNITRSGSSTVYATSSDYRLKEDLKDFAGLDMVSKIPVYDFKWKADESRSYGVMAHELEEVIPNAVSGDKDAEEMQGVDYSKIVPLLVKSIQELKSEIEELKSK
jgi:hypothetical protein